jgi:hypothetical protein
VQGDVALGCGVTGVNATIRLRDASCTRVASTDGGLGYEFSELPAGDYVVSVDPIADTYTPHGGAFWSGAVHVEAGQTATVSTWQTWGLGVVQGTAQRADGGTAGICVGENRGPLLPYDVTDAGGTWRVTVPCGLAHLCECSSGAPCVDATVGYQQTTTVSTPLVVP